MLPEDIWPILRPNESWRQTATPDYVRAVEDRPELEPVDAPFSPHLSIYLSILDGEWLRFLNHEDLAEASANFAEVMSKAVTNIESKRTDFQTQVNRRNIFSVSVPRVEGLDVRGSAVMFLASFWCREALIDDRKVLAFTHNRDFIAWTRLNPDAELEDVASLAAEFFDEEDTPLSPEAFVWRGDGWDLAYSRR